MSKKTERMKGTSNQHVIFDELTQFRTLKDYLFSDQPMTKKQWIEKYGDDEFFMSDENF